VYQVRLDGMAGIAYGLGVLLLVHFFGRGKDREPVPFLPVFHGLFVVAPISVGVARLLGGETLAMLRTALFSVLLFAVGLALTAIRHRERRAELLVYAAILGVLALPFAPACINGERYTSWEDIREFFG